MSATKTRVTTIVERKRIMKALLSQTTPGHWTPPIFHAFVSGDQIVVHATAPGGELGKSVTYCLTFERECLTDE